MNKARIPTLSERRESLSPKLFKYIVSNEQQKLANLLHPMASSHAQHMRNKRHLKWANIDHRSNECVHYCDDHSSFDFNPQFNIWNISYVTSRDTLILQFDTLIISWTLLLLASGGK